MNPPEESDQEEKDDEVEETEDDEEENPEETDPSGRYRKVGTAAVAAVCCSGDSFTFLCIYFSCALFCIFFRSLILARAKAN